MASRVILATVATDGVIGGIAAVRVIDEELRVVEVSGC
jgi:hypothetical protein